MSGLLEFRHRDVPGEMWGVDDGRGDSGFDDGGRRGYTTSPRRSASGSDGDELEEGEVPADVARDVRASRGASLSDDSDDDGGVGGHRYSTSDLHAGVAGRSGGPTDSGESRERSHSSGVRRLFDNTSLTSVATTTLRPLRRRRPAASRGNVKRQRTCGIALVAAAVVSLDHRRPSVEARRMVVSAAVAVVLVRVPVLVAVVAATITLLFAAPLRL
jgi:hypothetical protein